MAIRRDGAFVALLTLYMTLAALYSVVNPLFESPDEVWHYEYVRWLVEGNGLPHPDDVGHAPWHQEGSQPPLYYLSAAALTRWTPTDNAAAVIRYNPHGALGQADSYGNRNVMAHGPAQAWPWQGVTLAAHLARFFSVALGGLTVFFTYAIARTIFPDRRAVALPAAGLVALNPQFLFISAAVNNDVLVAMLSAAALFVLVGVVTRRDPDDPTRPAAPGLHHLLILGLLAGLGALSKLSGLLVAAFVGLVLTWVAWRRRSWALWLRAALVTGAVAALVAGWWYLRNWLLFNDPLALQAMFAILPPRPEPPTVAELLARAQGVWRSYWAVFGWFNVVAPGWLYSAYSGLSLLALGGLVLAWPLAKLYGRTQPPMAPGRRIALGLLILWTVAILLLLLRWATMRYPQGRLLFPAISSVAVLFAYGLGNWLPDRARSALSGGLLLLLLIPAALAPWQIIRPAYQPPVAPLYAGAPPNPVEATFDGRVRLVGYELGAVEVEPGGAVTVDLYWEALAPLPENLSVFIHLTDENQILQAQRDSFPGAGNFPTSAWPVGTVIHDRHLVTIPETAPAPAQLKVDVGLYDYATNTRLLVGGYDHWTLGYVTMLPATDGDLPHAVFINFDDQIALVGFDFDRRRMRPGETLTLTLWWEALAAPPLDYTVFTHLVLPPESVWAQEDDQPQDGAAPTSTWQVGQRIEDRYLLTLPESAPPGVYFVEIGIYDKATNDRLRVNFSDKGIVLGQVRVD